MTLKKEMTIFSVDHESPIAPVAHKDDEVAFQIQTFDGGSTSWLFLSREQITEVQDAITKAVADYEVWQAEAAFTPEEWDALSKDAQDAEWRLALAKLEGESINEEKNEV